MVAATSDIEEVVEAFINRSIGEAGSIECDRADGNPEVVHQRVQQQVPFNYPLHPLS